MAIQSVGGCSSCGKADTSSDYQVQKIQSQIDDWRTCPTTDAKTKQEKVSKLQNQLDGVKSALEMAAQRKAEAAFTGLGNRVDVYA